MLLAEDLLLLLTDDETGQLIVPGANVDAGLAGAVLLELTLLGRADLSRQGDPEKPGRVILRSRESTGEPILDQAMNALIEDGTVKPPRAVNRLTRDLRPRLCEQLAAKGILRAEKGKVLGITLTHRWPAEDTAHEDAVRRQLTEALTSGASPDGRTAALVALLHALRCEHQVVDPRSHGMSKRDLSARAELIAQGGWASEAVRRALDEMTAAVVGAVTVSTIVAVTST